MYLPLGRSCRISLKLRDLGARKEAFPFDWSLTPAKAINNLIRSDFFNWPDASKIIICEPIKRILVIDNFDKSNAINDSSEPRRTQILDNTLVRPVLCKRTGIFFPHEPFNESPDSAVDSFVEKYTRRVNRMRTAISQGGIVGVHDGEYEPNAFQMSYIDRYLGKGSCEEFFGDESEPFDALLAMQLLGNLVDFSTLTP